MNHRLLGSVAVTVALGLAATGAPAAQAVTAKVETNTSFAGFSATPKAHITKASVSFVVPTVTCKKKYSGVGPSISIDSTTNNKTDSFTAAGGGVAASCENSTPIYEALVIIPLKNGSIDNDNAYPVKAGDRITVTVTYGAKTVSTVTDTTSKQTKTDRGPRSVGASAFVGDSGVAIGKLNLGIDPFTTTHFTAVTVNGHSLKRLKAERTDWTDKRKVVLIAASGLGADGKSFSTAFKQSN